jgi:hypothetical protein
MRRFGLDVAVFGGILLLGLARLPEPFTGDQALNMLMGRVIADGGAPYADLWDLKHPGVFFFFAAGGVVFWFHEIGIHLFELLWMLVLAFVVRVTAGHYLRNRPAASLAPALTVGAYYAGATSFHLTQTEALVGLPLLLSLVAAAAAVRPGCRQPLIWLFASGVSAGVVLVFKAPYVLLPGLFWLLGLAEWRRVRGQGIMSGAVHMAAPLVAGVLVPASVVAVYLAQKPGLGLVWWTFVVHPREAAGQATLDPQRLLEGSIWFARTFSLPMALAIMGGWDRLRRGWDLLTAGLVAWMAAGVLLIWMQVISWWSYHYLLLFVPMGLLAAQGVETLWNAVAATVTPRQRRAAAAAALLGLSVLSVAHVEPAARSVAGVFRARSLPADTASLRVYQAERNRDYADALATTSFLRDPGSHPGPIYVFASPILYPLAGRPPATPLLAPWFHPTSERWHRLMAELWDASPPYVLVSDWALEAITGYNPALEREVDLLRSRLAQRYLELRTDVGGTWYVRAELAAHGHPKMIHAMTGNEVPQWARIHGSVP